MYCGSEDIPEPAILLKNKWDQALIYNMGDENLLQASRIILALDDNETTCAYPA